MPRVDGGSRPVGGMPRTTDAVAWPVLRASPPVPETAHPMWVVTRCDPVRSSGAVGRWHRLIRLGWSGPQPPRCPLRPSLDGARAPVKAPGSVMRRAEPHRSARQRARRGDCDANRGPSTAAREVNAAQCDVCAAAPVRCPPRLARRPTDSYGERPVGGGTPGRMPRRVASRRVDGLFEPSGLLRMPPVVGRGALLARRRSGGFSARAAPQLVRGLP